MNPDPQINPDEQESLTPEITLGSTPDVENVEVVATQEAVEPIIDPVAASEGEAVTVDAPSEPAAESLSVPAEEPVTVPEPAVIASEPVAPVTEVETETPVIENMPAEAETEPQVVSVPSESLAVASSPKPKKKLFVLLAVVFGVLLVLAGGAYAAYTLWYNNPKKVVSDAFSKLINAENISLDGSLVGESSTAKTTVKLSLVANNEKSSGSFQLDFTQSDTTASLKAQFAAERDKLFVKLEDLQKMLNAAYGEALASQMQQYFGTLMQKIDGKWVVVTTDDLSELTKSESSKETTCVQDEIGKLQSDSGKRLEFTKLLNDNFFIDITDKGTASVEGVQSNHYVLQLNKETYKKFLEGLKETSVFKVVDDCLKDTDLVSQVDENMKSLDSTTTNEKQQTYELWVGTWSHEITRFSISNSNATSGTTQQLTLLPKINTNPQITMPTADTTIDDIKSEIETLTQQFQTAASQYVTPASSNTYTTQYY